MQGPGVGFQLFQFFRYAFLLLASISVPLLGLVPSDPDLYESLALAGSAVSFFWVTGLFDAHVVRYQAVSEDERQSVVKTTFWMANLLAMASAVSVLALSRQTSGVWLGYAVFLFFELASFFLPIHLLVKGRGKALAWYGLAAYGGYAVIVALGIHSGWSMETIFWSSSAWGAIRWVWTCALGKPWIGSWKLALAPLLKLSIPLMGVALISQGAVILDGYLAKGYFPDQFAAFRYGSKEFPLVLLMANALSTTFAGQISGGIRQERLQDSLEKMKSSILPVMYLGFASTIALLLVSGFVFELALGAEYAEAVPVFDVCMLFAIPRLVFPQTVVRGYQRGWVLTMSAAIELTSKVILSFLFIPFLGLPGLVIATFIGFLLEKLFLIGYCHRFLKLPLSAYTPSTEWLIGSGLLLTAFVLKYWLF